MNNYPPGVTGNEPQIAGERHHPECPQHEDYTEEHKCANLKRYGNSLIEHWDGGWRMVVRNALSRAQALGVEFCPYCGDDLPSLACICASIRDVAREDATLERGGL